MQRTQPRAPHAASMLFIFLLIGLFAVASLTLTLIGTRVYRDVTAKAESSGDAQMLMSYLGNKVHAYDTAGAVTVETIGGLNTLCLHETLDGERYMTAIYAWQGGVWERFAAEGEPFDPEDGERLISAASLTFAMLQGNLIEAQVTLAGGETHVVRMALRAAAKEGSTP